MRLGGMGNGQPNGMNPMGNGQAPMNNGMNPMGTQAPTGVINLVKGQKIDLTKGKKE